MKWNWWQYVYTQNQMVLRCTNGACGDDVNAGDDDHDEVDDGGDDDDDDDSSICALINKLKGAV